MLPSCGCSQFSLIVGTAPMFSRSMCVASMQAAAKLLASSVIAVQTSVGPIVLEHLLLRALDDRHEREHVFLLRHRGVGRRRSG